ncbi:MULTISPECIES: ABC transporter substrate-binding protein [unclassified Mesorhizobium]|uniref:ABC transporter substrate-binding protein n=1 Tax=unclassified Mesorhizobium TaxID=325217 RepID=UPI000FD58E29|nr:MULTISPECIES: ABC transporter substrate-binding protein [unclassified Mesorhizobium]RVB80589.1 ABC transporter substrate-binding protein [Mesorhizobium sp. M6A.T.Cr.TU.014.01.1.1]RWQ06445.1 MAG: ABC transporter substrate-binding protein [Mesorhizobium sp.]RWQ10825.1 MAG: ABC transporter substrate-binding protein [Mesorhizobium sp.]
MKLVSGHLAALMMSCAALTSGGMAIAQAADVVIVANGGATQDAERKAVWEPAAKALGFKFDEDTSQSWTEGKAQVDSGAVTWDIVSLNMGEVPLAVKSDILTKLPADVVDRKDFVPGAVNDYCVGNTVFSTNIAYSTAKYGDAGPTSFADFWDLKKFPGKRLMFKSPRGNMEAAALALGHPRSEVYKFLSTEEGRKAALDKIAELKPYAVWFDSGAQSTQLIKDGEVDMAYGWNGRIIAAMDAGAPFKINYKDGLLDIDCYAVLKGAPHVDNAIKFVSEISKAEYVKDLPKYIAYGSPNLKANPSYDETTLDRLTTSPQNVKEQYTTDFDFWGKYGTTLSEAFDHMLASN